MDPAPQLHHELAFRIRRDTLPDGLTLSRTSPESEGHTQIGTASRDGWSQCDSLMDMNDQGDLANDQYSKLSYRGSDTTRSKYYQ